MRDQAENLRIMVDSLQTKIRDELFGLSPRRCRVIAVTSGKGGVGKTNISVGLSIILAKAGYRVMLMDGDMGMANVDVLLGKSPKYDLSHVVRGEKELSEVVMEGPCGLKIIPGGSALGEIVNVDSLTLTRVLREVTLLDKTTDYLFIDTGAGISNQVLPYLLSAREILLVTTPEPTALADAYSLIKVFYKNHGKGILKIVVNMVKSRQDGCSAARRLQDAACSFLDLEIEALGNVSFDLAVHKAIRQHMPYVMASPNSPAALDTAKIASDLGGIPLEHPSGAESFFSNIMSLFSNRKAFVK